MFDDQISSTLNELFLRRGDLGPKKHDPDIICTMDHIISVAWKVQIADDFEPEFDALPEEVQTEILALSRLLQQFGPRLGRPRVTSRE